MGKAMPIRAEEEAVNPMSLVEKRKLKKNKADHQYAPIDMLSFVKKTKTGSNYWDVDASSLTYGQQCQLGKAMAMETLEAVRKTGFTPLLGWIIFAQIQTAHPMGKDRGVIAGFSSYICQMAAFS